MNRLVVDCDKQRIGRENTRLEFGLPFPGSDKGEYELFSVYLLCDHRLEGKMTVIYDGYEFVKELNREDYCDYVSTDMKRQAKYVIGFKLDYPEKRKFPLISNRIIGGGIPKTIMIDGKKKRVKSKLIRACEKVKVIVEGSHKFRKNCYVRYMLTN